MLILTGNDLLIYMLTEASIKYNNYIASLPKRLDNTNIVMVTIDDMIKLHAHTMEIVDIQNFVNIFINTDITVDYAIDILHNYIK